MTKGQTIGIYFPLWRRVCLEMGWNPSDKEKRHAFHAAHDLPVAGDLQQGDERREDADDPKDGLEEGAHGNDCVPKVADDG